MLDGHGRVAWLFSFLAAGGFQLERYGKGHSYRVVSPIGKVHPLRPVLVVDDDDLDEYVEERIAASTGVPAGKDVEEDVLGLVSLNVLEELSVDHGSGYNYVRSLGFRRRGGRVEFFVDSTPPPPGEPDPDSPLTWSATP